VNVYRRTSRHFCSVGHSGTLQKTCLQRGMACSRSMAVRRVSGGLFCTASQSGARAITLICDARVTRSHDPRAPGSSRDGEQRWHRPPGEGHPEAEDGDATHHTRRRVQLPEGRPRPVPGPGRHVDRLQGRRHLQAAPVLRIDRRRDPREIQPPSEGRYCQDRRAKSRRRIEGRF